MLSFLTKKKITEDKLSQIFVTSTLKTCDEGFAEVALLITEDPEFASPPIIDPENSDEFLMIVIAGNLEYIPKYFTDYQDIRLLDKIHKKLAAALQLDLTDLKKLINHYQNYLKRVNHPSKNTHYAMSKAIFFKYNLNEYQQDYFRKMKTPNPIFLKRLDEIVANFIWNWEDIREKYKVIE